MQPHSATLASPSTLASRSKRRAVEHVRDFHLFRIRRSLRFAALQLNWGCSGTGHHHGSRTRRRVTDRPLGEARLTSRRDAPLRLHSYHFTYPTRTVSAVPDPANNYGTNTSLETSTVYDFSTGSAASQTDANMTIIKVEI